MQLSVREASQFLNVSEPTVVRWIKQRGLPAQQIAGRYHFHRAELLEWATANRVKVSLEMFDRFETNEEPVPTLAEALEAGGIHYQLERSHAERKNEKAGILRSLIEVLPLPDGIDRELLLRLFLARESCASTAIGDGIALPHVRNPIVLHVAHPAITLAFLKQAVDFGALDGKPVHVLFSIISPTNRSHLQLISHLSFALHDRQLRESVIRQAAREEILQEVRRVESSMGVRDDDVGKAAR